MDDQLLTKRILEWAVEGLEEALRQGEVLAAATYRRALLHVEATAYPEAQEAIAA